MLQVVALRQTQGARAFAAPVGSRSSQQYNRIACGDLRAQPSVEYQQEPQTHALSYVRVSP